MSLSEQQIAKAKQIIEQHERLIDAKKVSRSDAVLVFRYLFDAPRSLAEEAVAYGQGHFKGDVIKVD